MEVVTTRTSAQVKVMLSYDYCHFEASCTIENANGVDNYDIDGTRKDMQRICDKAVRQYKVAKEMANNRQNSEYEKQRFASQCSAILNKSECDRTVKEIAMLKQYQNEEWESQFNYSYNYMDDIDNEI